MSIKGAMVRAMAVFAVVTVVGGVAVQAVAQQQLQALNEKTIERRNYFDIPQWSGITIKDADGKDMVVKASSGTAGNLLYRGYDGNYIETNDKGYIYIYGYDPSNAFQEFFTAFVHKIWIKVGPNSRVVFDRSTRNKTVYYTVTLTKGSWQEDKGAKEISKLDDFIDFINCASGSVGHKIQKQVAGWKSSGKWTDDQLADTVISRKSKKTGFYGAIAGIGGALSIPNQLLSVATDWVVQAEMAYAIACVYMPNPPSEARFKKDLYMLLCDTDVRDATLKSERIDPATAITDVVVGEMSEALVEKLMKELATRMTKKLAQKAATTGAKAVPVLGSFLDANANFSNAKEVGKKAKVYYNSQLNGVWEETGGYGRTVTISGSTATLTGVKDKETRGLNKPHWRILSRKGNLQWNGQWVVTAQTGETWVNGTWTLAKDGKTLTVGDNSSSSTWTRRKR